MKKYIEVIKIGFKDMIAYRFDVFSGTLFSFFRILLAFLLWSAIYHSNAEVAGYSFNMMITYYIIVTSLLKLDKSHEVSEMLSGEIRDGKFTKYIIKPVHPIGYYFSMIFSKFTYVLGFNVLATLLWVLLFKKYFVMPDNIMNCVLAVGIFMIGLLFMALINYFFTILTFWVLDASGFFMIKDNILEFLSGSLIPLSLLPGSIITIFKFLPFYYVYFYPISLYLNPGEQNVILAISTLLIWSIFFLLLNNWLYKKALRSYEGVGI